MSKSAWPHELRSRLELDLEGVDGWFTIDEALALYDAVLAAPSVGGRVDCVEIGSFKGRSTIAIARALQQRGQPGALAAIDPHDGDICGEAGEDRYRAFVENVRSRGLQDRVVQVRSFSHDAAPDVSDGSVSLLFIDGSHAYADVIADIGDWVPKLADGAIVLFNDPFHREVAWAIRDTVHRHRMPMRRPRLSTNTLIFDYRPASRTTMRDGVDRWRLRAMLPVGWRLSNFLISLGTSRTWLAFASPVLVGASQRIVRLLVPRVEPVSLAEPRLTNRAWAPGGAKRSSR